MSDFHAMRRLAWSFYGRHVWRSARELDPSTFDACLDRVAGDVGRPLDILDAGCGAGAHAVALANQGHRVVGVDYAPGMLRRAKDAVPEALADSLSFRQIDLTRVLPFADCSFDRVLSVSSLQAVSDPGFTSAELRRVLRHDGRLVILHAPLPEWYALPLRRALMDRFRNSRAHGFSRRPFVIAKALVERWGATRHWTDAELRRIVEQAGFQVQRAHPGRLTIFVCKPV